MKIVRATGLLRVQGSCFILQLALTPQSLLVAFNFSWNHGSSSTFGQKPRQALQRQTGGLTTHCSSHCTVCDTYYEKVPHTTCQATLYSSVRDLPFLCKCGQDTTTHAIEAQIPCHEPNPCNTLRTGLIYGVPTSGKSQYKVGYKYCLSICNIFAADEGRAQGCDELLVV